MQNEDNIQIGRNPMQQENNYITPPQGPCLKIGHVSFSLDKLNKNNMNSLPFDYLTKLYPHQYQLRKVQQGIKNIPNDNDKQQKTDLMRAQPEQYFTLEYVLDYHFQFVSSTSQQKFMLKDSDFRILDKCKFPIYQEINLWKVSFLHLKILNISESRISSIQALTFCDLPSIEHLQLQHNNILSLSALSKCSFKSLTSIKCFNNPLITMDKFNRSLLPSLTKLQIIDNKIEDFHERDSQQKRFIGQIQRLQSLQFILKTEGNNKLTQFRLGFENKIQPIWYRKQLKKLNSSLQIFTEQQIRQRRLQHGPRPAERRNLVQVQQLLNQEPIIQQIPLRTRRQMINIRNRRRNHQLRGNVRRRPRGNLLMRGRMGMFIRNQNQDQIPIHQNLAPFVDINQFVFPNRQ